MSNLLYTNTIALALNSLVLPGFKVLQAIWSFCRKQAPDESISKYKYNNWRGAFLGDLCSRYWLVDHMISSHSQYSLILRVIRWVISMLLLKLHLTGTNVWTSLLYSLLTTVIFSSLILPFSSLILPPKTTVTSMFFANVCSSASWQ